MIFGTEIKAIDLVTQCLIKISMNEIKNLLPHRDPFLFVDYIELTEDIIVGFRTFSKTEFFFQGHFPDYPVVPGVILIETMAQIGGAGAKKMNALSSDALFFLATVEKAKFRRQVRPEEQVRFEIFNDRLSPRMLRQSGKAYLGKKIAAEAQWMCLVGSTPS